MYVTEAMSITTSRSVMSISVSIASPNSGAVETSMSPATVRPGRLSINDKERENENGVTGKADPQGNRPR